MISNELITILMPVHNGEKYIKLAIDSILSQTYSNYELLIIDDASTDKTVKIIQSYADPRIKLLHNSKKSGLAMSRQHGIDEAKGRYIAFLDSDDIANPNRLATQVKYLESHSSIAMVGTWVETIDQESHRTGKVWKHATAFEYIQSILLFRNCFTQSSVMMQKNCLKDYPYRADYEAAPDFDLWSRLAGKYRLANIPEVLTYYRVYKQSMSFVKDKDIEECTRKIEKNSLQRLGIIPTEQQLILHDSLERQKKVFSNPMLGDIGIWLRVLLKANKKKSLYTAKEFENVVRYYWFKACSTSAGEGMRIYDIYKHAEISQELPPNVKMKSMLFALCMAKYGRSIDITSETWIRIMHG